MKLFLKYNPSSRPPKFLHGNLEAKRDFTNVKDTVKAYWALVNEIEFEYGRVFNISTGIAYSGKYIKETLSEIAGLPEIVKDYSGEDPKRMRPSDVPILLGDCNRLMSRTGWRPKIDFKDTLKEMYNWWYVKLEKECY